jgi:hypothetical protein
MFLCINGFLRFSQIVEVLPHMPDLAGSSRILSLKPSRPATFTTTCFFKIKIRAYLCSILRLSNVRGSLREAPRLMGRLRMNASIRIAERLYYL